MSPQKQFEGPDVRALLDQIYATYGPDPTISRAETFRTGGLLGFFQREQFRLVVEGEPPAGAHTAIVQPVVATQPAPGMEPVPGADPFASLADATEDSVTVRMVPAPAPAPAAVTALAAVAGKGRTPTSEASPSEARSFESVLQRVATMVADTPAGEPASDLESTIRAVELTAGAIGSGYSIAEDRTADEVLAERAGTAAVEAAANQGMEVQGTAGDGFVGAPTAPIVRLHGRIRPGSEPASSSISDRVGPEAHPSSFAPPWSPALAEPEVDTWLAELAEHQAPAGVGEQVGDRAGEPFPEPDSPHLAATEGKGNVFGLSWPVDPAATARRLALLRVGFDEEAAARIEAGVSAAGLDAAVLQVLEDHPEPPRLPRQPGSLIVVVGAGARAFQEANRIAAEVGSDPSMIAYASQDRPAWPVADRLILHTSDDAYDFAPGHRGGRVGIVAVDSPAGATSAPWARHVLSALSPTLVVGVVDAMYKNEDIDAWAEAVGGVGALVVDNVRATVSPARLLDLDAPVSHLADQPATPTRWAATVLDRISLPEQEAARHEVTV